jgi:trans-aconitate 2-methyltransferase
VNSFDCWDPDQYNRFAAQREQPFWDLARMIGEVAQPVVVDLGCGDGRLTSLLSDELGASSMLGIDRSLAMIEAASKRARERLTFSLGDLETWQDDRAFDVVFANGCPITTWCSPDGRAHLNLRVS